MDQIIESIQSPSGNIEFKFGAIPLSYDGEPPSSIGYLMIRFLCFPLGAFEVDDKDALVEIFKNEKGQLFVKTNPTNEFLEVEIDNAAKRPKRNTKCCSNCDIGGPDLHYSSGGAYNHKEGYKAVDEAFYDVYCGKCLGFYGDHRDVWTGPVSEASAAAPIASADVEIIDVDGDAPDHFASAAAAEPIPSAAAEPIPSAAAEPIPSAAAEPIASAAAEESDSDAEQEINPYDPQYAKKGVSEGYETDSLPSGNEEAKAAVINKNDPHQYHFNNYDPDFHA